MNKPMMEQRATDARTAPRRIVLAPGDEELHWITQRDKYLIRDFRHVMRENQTAFWRRFGVTQTRGSRFERGKAMPLPVLMLVRLYLKRVISDADLLQVRAADDADGPL
ncbi:hypothetical protein [Duganella callida]|uniref:RsaL-like HTH domain-containing protein n=1 Tax=Duganella callida TaxID=2561932 RepID=A0A4Y9T0Z3_9BURK|nr:hypothetical protein [Duganella callida]TFW31230.1 hypothetical protein E4L98_00605 [Duganella callida]